MLARHTYRHAYILQKLTYTNIDACTYVVIFAKCGGLLHLNAFFAQFISLFHLQVDFVVVVFFVNMCVLYCSLLCYVFETLISSSWQGSVL